jgi:hypothetical protein
VIHLGQTTYTYVFVKASNNAARVSELKTALKKNTREHFDWLESQRKAQFQELTSKLNALQTLLETRSQNAEQIIERRMKQLLGESDSLDWNPDSAKGLLGDPRSIPSDRPTERPRALGLGSTESKPTDQLSEMRKKREPGVPDVVERALQEQSNLLQEQLRARGLAPSLELSRAQRLEAAELELERARQSASDQLKSAREMEAAIKHNLERAKQEAEDTMRKREAAKEKAEAEKPKTEGTQDAKNQQPNPQDI